MNKLGREHVKNNLKWIYVQPTSSSLKIDGLGPVLSCVLFSSPYPVPERAGCRSQGGKRRFVLSDGHPVAGARAPLPV